MKPLDTLSVKEFTEKLASDAPSPGGGSAAAVTAGLGAALAEMACRINAKRKSNPAPDQSRHNAEAASKLREELLRLVTEDAQAFLEISNQWKNKGPGLQAALKKAATVPMGIAACALRAARIAQDEAPRTSKHLMSDIVESGLILRQSVESARLNVEINLRMLEDEPFVAAQRSRIDESVAEARQLSQELEKHF